jgi:hypothetical protein
MLFPIIKVKDNETGYEHIIGTNSHDMLCVEDGLISYYNLQNGEGSRFGTYSFLGEEDEMYGVTVEFVTFEKLKEIYDQETKASIEQNRAMKEMIEKIIQDKEIWEK